MVYTFDKWLKNTPVVPSSGNGNFEVWLHNVPVLVDTTGVGGEVIIHNIETLTSRGRIQTLRPFHVYAVSSLYLRPVRRRVCIF